MSAKRIKILFILLIGIFIYAPSVFAFSVEDQKAINELNKNYSNVVSENKLLKNDIELIKSNQLNTNLATQKLVDGVNIKNEGIDFKSHYYDLALELLTLFGVIVVAVAIVVGILKKNQIADAREEMRDLLDDFRKEQDRMIDLSKERVDYEIEKMKDNDKQNIKKIEYKYKNFALSIRDSLAEKEIKKIDDSGVVDEKETKEEELIF